MEKYGQHFLINEGIIRQITDAALLLRGENCVEIGPGKGALTEVLLARGRHPLTAVEIDKEMVDFLSKRFKKEDVKIIHQNFLDFPLETLPPVPTEFVSNLPYIDAAAILDKVLSFAHFQSAVFMFQKEQAQKITARPSDDLYGPLSVLTQLRAQISLVCNVGRGCFNPPPKVESRVLAFVRKTPPQTDAKKLKKIVKSAFLHRRKTLLNALCLGGYDKEKISRALAELSLSVTVRPEQVSPQQYVSLTEKI